MSVARRAQLRLIPRAGYAQPSDHDLARALAADEPWAAAATWNQHSPMVFRFLQRALGPDAEVEDLTQEVFLLVFAKARGLRDPDALRSFVFSIAVRKLKWEMRRRRVRRMFELSALDELPEQATAVLDVEARQALRHFYAILDHLRAEERVAFVLRHLEGMTLGEVAGALGVSLATAKRRLDRASRTVSRYVDQDPTLAGYAAAAGRRT
jgi:RNA polymerase sigma-70 factor (ECF subfamily)